MGRISRSWTLVAVGLLLHFASPPVTAQKVVQKALPGGGAENVEERAENVGGHLELFGGSSFLNSYTRGDLDVWFGELTGDAGGAVDDGSPAFFHGRATLFFGRSAGSSVEMGIGLGGNIPVAHSLWGSQIFYGGKTEVVLQPLIATTYLAVRIFPDDQGSVSLTLLPGLSVGGVTGDVHYGSYDYTISGGVGLGGTVGASMDLSLGGVLGLSVEGGYRMLRTPLSFEDGTSNTGYSQFLLASGDEVFVDLGGAYVMAGMALRF